MKEVPYNTGKVLIGCRYEPQRRNHMTPEGEFIQSVLLGEYNYRRRQAVRWTLYVAGLMLMMFFTGVMT